MAAALALLSATPEMLKYSWTYDGTGGAGSGSAFRSRAQMIADLLGVAGPSALKALLQATTDTTAWTNLQNSGVLSCYDNILGMANFTCLEMLIQSFVPSGLGLQVNGKDGNAGSAIIEIRFHHTFVR